MAPESWFLLTVAAAFLLLGIAASPLAWVALMQRRSQNERQNDLRFLKLAEHIRALEDRLERCEVPHEGLQTARTNLAHPSQTQLRSTRATGTLGRLVPKGLDFGVKQGEDEPRLIAIPNLASTTSDRDATLNSLTQRYAAIWSLADTGASADVIARATGQPIGQIELILGLRRQFDGPRPNVTISHARHE